MVTSVKSELWDMKPNPISDYGNTLGFYNSKITNQARIYGFKVGTTFDLLAGWTCPMAKECQTFVHKKGGKTWETWGKDAIYSCYAADIEARYKNAYELHKRNWELTKTDKFVDTLVDNIWRSGTNFHRWHSSGEFYDWVYFQKVIQVIKQLPDVYFYAYTKQATFYKWYLNNSLPNFDMIYSFGGRMDNYAIQNNLPMAKVIIDPKYKFALETDEGLPIACQAPNKYNDIEYIHKQESFGLFVH